jgi:hypothetical protein
MAPVHRAIGMGSDRMLDNGEELEGAVELAAGLLAGPDRVEPGRNPAVSGGSRLPDMTRS